jgi:hypothetical protein
MGGMKGYDCGKVEKTTPGTKTIWVLECTGEEGNIPIRNTMAALSYVRSYGEDVPDRSKGKSYNAMHIAQVWCPESRYDENQQIIEDIIASLELGKD